MRGVHPDAGQAVALPGPAVSAPASPAAAASPTATAAAAAAAANARPSSGPGRTTPQLVEARERRLAAAKALTNELTACTGWRQLQALLAARRSELNTIHVSAALARTAHAVAESLSLPQPTAAPSASTSAPAPSWPTPSGAGGAAQQPHLSIQRLPSDEAAALRRFLRAELVPLLGSRLISLDPRQLSTSAWALARLGHSPEPFWWGEWAGCVARR
jgi:hypothetical protein